MKKSNYTQQVKKEKVKIVIYTRNTINEQKMGHRQYRDIQVLKEKYKRLGYEVSRIYTDAGCHGNTIGGRPVLQKLLNDAPGGLFDVVLVWDVYSLTPNGEDLLSIEELLNQYDVELCSATEPFDTSTEEGKKHFYYMSMLLEDESLACKEDISLSAFAWLVITRGASLKGGELVAQSS
jgi:DNA invertase Pin-like site-specific DNA recombinase